MKSLQVLRSIIRTMISATPIEAKRPIVAKISGIPIEPPVPIKSDT